MIELLELNIEKNKLNLDPSTMINYLDNSDLLKSKGYKSIVLCKNGERNNAHVADADNNTEKQIELFHNILNEEIFNNEKFDYNDEKTLYSLKIYGVDFIVNVIKDNLDYKYDFFRLENKFYDNGIFINNSDYCIIEKIKKEEL